MTPELKAKWVEALRSGSYKQLHGCIKDSNKETGITGYCCSGVLCEVAGKDALKAGYSGFVSSEMAHEIGLPSAGALEVDNFNGDGPVERYDNNSFQIQAAARNDLGWTFAQIADWIGQQPLEATR